MPSIDDVYTGSSLSAKDLKGKTVNLSIESVELKEFADGRKLIVGFVGTDKALICNKTNATRIAESHGSDYTKWAGKKIKLYPDRVEFKGDIVDAIRVELPVRETEEFNDDVPF